MEQPLIFLDTNTSSITDADEEIFLLYSALNQTNTNLVGPNGHHGLGHIDSRRGTLMISFELQPSVLSPSPEKPAKKSKHSRKKADITTKVVVIEIAQDPTALRSRIGDTGSVVWRASTELARALLQQHFFPPESPLFSRDRLAKSHCLELGAGTGLLGVALAPLVRTYAITDTGPLLPLIQKNVSLNTSNQYFASSKHNITIEELDWLTLASLPPGTPRKCYCPIPAISSDVGSESNDRSPWDLVLAVDCIYNPSLLPALVETIDAVSTAEQTWVLVVAELRQEDVLREFLDLWLKCSDGRWEIAQVEGLLDVHFVIWAGRKR